jgi:replicative DNA helicase
MNLRRQKTDEGVSANNLMDLFQTQMDARLDGTYVPALYPKIRALQEILDSYEDQDFPIIAARPGDGKSSLMRWEAYKEAKSGRRVAIVNLENAETEYARWLVAMETGIDASKLRKPRSMNADEMQLVKDALRELRSIPLRVITMGSPSAREVLRTLLPEVRAGAKSIWIDYIQKVYNGVDNRVNDISISSGLLRGFSLKHHVVVGCGAQLSRAIVNRGEDAEPELSDLRESGSLEQDATHVMFPRKVWARPSEQDLRTFPENRDGRVRAIPMKIFIKKNRNGSVGVTGHIKWSKHINHYETLATEN